MNELRLKFNNNMNYLKGLVYISNEVVELLNDNSEEQKKMVDIIHTLDFLVSNLKQFGDDTIFIPKSYILSDM